MQHIINKYKNKFNTCFKIMIKILDLIEFLITVNYLEFDM